jgi:hypothetical protein
VAVRAPAGFPGEHSLALGTPGLPDERPVGLWAIEGQTLCSPFTRMIVAGGGSYTFARTGDYRMLTRVSWFSISVLADVKQLAIL